MKSFANLINVNEKRPPLAGGLFRVRAARQGADAGRSRSAIAVNAAVISVAIRRFRPRGIEVSRGGVVVIAALKAADAAIVLRRQDLSFAIDAGSTLRKGQGAGADEQRCDCKQF